MHTKPIRECIQQPFLYLPQTGNNQNALQVIQLICGTAIQWNTTRKQKGTLDIVRAAILNYR